LTTETNSKGKLNKISIQQVGVSYFITTKTKIIVNEPAGVAGNMNVRNTLLQILCQHGRERWQWQNVNNVSSRIAWALKRKNTNERKRFENKLANTTIVARTDIAYLE
jgi:hypothetical protein